MVHISLVVSSYFNRSLATASETTINLTLIIWFVRKSWEDVTMKNTIYPTEPSLYCLFKVSTDTAIVIKNTMFNKKFTFCFKNHYEIALNKAIGYNHISYSHINLTAYHMKMPKSRIACLYSKYDHMNWLEDSSLN